MGMELTATWRCDRCGHTQTEVQGKKPLGWDIVTRLSIVVLENNELDVKLPVETDKNLLCGECMDSYHHFLEAFLATAGPQEYVIDDPVVGEEAAPEVSEKEK